jgi:hypothetical protein
MQPQPVLANKKPTHGLLYGFRQISMNGENLSKNNWIS